MSDMISIQKQKEKSPINITRQNFKQEEKYDIRQILAAEDFDRSMRMNSMRQQADKKKNESRSAVEKKKKKRFYQPTDNMNISKSDDIDRDELSRLFTSGTYIAINGIPLWMLRLWMPMTGGIY